MNEIIFSSHTKCEVMKMGRKKQMDYLCPSKKHSDLDYEFAYELGADFMRNELEKKEEYLKTLKEREKKTCKNCHEKKENNRVEFSNIESMRPLEDEYYADVRFEPSNNDEAFNIEKHNHKIEKNFRKC